MNLRSPESWGHPDNVPSQNPEARVPPHEPISLEVQGGRFQALVYFQSFWVIPGPTHVRTLHRCSLVLWSEQEPGL